MIDLRNFILGMFAGIGVSSVFVIVWFMAANVR